MPGLSGLTGPSGLSGIMGGGAFDPLSLSPIVWLKADAGTYQDAAKTTPATADTDPVGAWEDQSGNGNDVTQAVNPDRPLLRLNIKNGLPVLRFDGANSILQGAFGAAVTQPFSGFAVAQLDPTAVNDGVAHCIFDGDDVVNRAYIRAYQVATPDAWSMFAGTEVIGGNSDSNWNIWSVLFNGASSQFWLNGTSEASGNAGAGGIDGLTVGCRYANSIWFWKGDISEILIYDPSLSTANRQLVEGYLSSRWDITLP